MGILVDALRPAAALRGGRGNARLDYFSLRRWHSKVPNGTAHRTVLGGQADLGKIDGPRTQGDGHADPVSGGGCGDGSVDDMF
jgi:hypothetical protein